MSYLTTPQNKELKQRKFIENTERKYKSLNSESIDNRVIYEWFKKKKKEINISAFEISNTIGTGSFGLVKVGKIIIREDELNFINNDKEKNNKKNDPNNNNKNNNKQIPKKQTKIKTSHSILSKHKLNSWNTIKSVFKKKKNKNKNKTMTKQNCIKENKEVKENKKLNNENNNNNNSSKEFTVAIKMLNKKSILDLKQLSHVLSEKQLLYECMDNSFIVSLYSNFQDVENVYLVLEYIIGGELFTLLRDRERLEELQARFYCMEVISAIMYLHSKNIIYRDLKPENILININGHIKITDFGFAKHTTENSYTLCGTPEYLAPEIISNKGHYKACDIWALGVLTYEMIGGYPPFYDNDLYIIYKKILASDFEFNEYFSKNCKDFIVQCLKVDIPLRLGCGIKGEIEICKHIWFSDINWDNVNNRKLVPPMIPNINDYNSTKYFDEYPNETISTPKQQLTDEQLLLFQEW